ncbi:HipA N-terminal domain-containing protein, partial [Mesorhizobium japonicum]|uniref:HipA N-terminal domain-containing protein n=1 Tax=Mesorhizobium japonicum TaxID=2066070 RepID=UPI003B5BB6EF
MAFQHADVIEVMLGTRRVGVLAPGRGAVDFQYDGAWARGGIELSPFLQPLSDGTRVRSFRGLRAETFHLLPPMIADALPDRFGNRIIDAWMARQGVTSSEITPLDRLAYVGDRAMGALRFVPATGPTAPDPSILDLERLT